MQTAHANSSELPLECVKIVPVSVPAHFTATELGSGRLRPEVSGLGDESVCPIKGASQLLKNRIPVVRAMVCTRSVSQRGAPLVRRGQA